MTLKGTDLAMWESNSREYQKFGAFIAQNRKNLKLEFESVFGGKIERVEAIQTGVTLDQCKQVFEKVLGNKFMDQVTEEKIKVLLQPAEIQGSTSKGQVQYNFMKLFEVYKNRHAAPQT